jgi:threonine aldolase
MRAAMAAAPVGDDQYGEDPLTNELQDRVAALLGKDAGLWLPSGTMANQVALRVLTRPATRSSSAARRTPAGTRPAGRPPTRACSWSRSARAASSTRRRSRRPSSRAGLPVYPPTTLVEIENTHNRSGGIVFPQDDVVRVCALARERGIATFLDGARLWNASVASGVAERELAAPFDLVAVSFSKGLGAPGGSLLAGSKALIAAATRHRRMLGGAMRQTGFFAAAALHGIDRHRAASPTTTRTRAASPRRSPRTRRSRSTSRRCRRTSSSSASRAGAVDAATLVQRARARGVLVNAFDARTIRAVTHLDVSAAQVEQAGAGRAGRAAGLKASGASVRQARRRERRRRRRQRPGGGATSTQTFIATVCSGP